jgi:hypothetical protein
MPAVPIGVGEPVPAPAAPGIEPPTPAPVDGKGGDIWPFSVVLQPAKPAIATIAVIHGLNNDFESFQQRMSILIIPTQIRGACQSV